MNTREKWILFVELDESRINNNNKVVNYGFNGYHAAAAAAAAAAYSHRVR